VRRELATALRRARGVEVVGATGSADEALRIVRECEPDIVLLDVKRDDGAGLKLCRQLSRNAKDLAVIVFTSYLSTAEWARAKEAGAVDYLLKQIDSSALVAKITQVATRHRGGHS
jgi:two-component system response regulator DevR